jgi:hypothetical protein
VRFKVLLTDRDQVEYPFDACCGCTCTTVANPRAPLECNAPFDFDAEILPNNVGILTQEGFQSISLNASNVTGNATFFAGASGYTGSRGSRRLRVQQQFYEHESLDAKQSLVSVFPPPPPFFFFFFFCFASFDN